MSERESKGEQKAKQRKETDLDSGHINGAVGNRDEEGEELLAGRLIQWEVTLMLTHDHDQYLPASHTRDVTPQ